MAAKKIETPAEPQAETIAAPPAMEVALSQNTTKEVAAPKSIEEMNEEQAGSGLEGANAGDYSIPFFSVLQKGSPQVDTASPKFLQFATQGAFMNTVTQELYSGKDGITVVHCAFKKSCVRWKDRDSGGGLVGHYNENDPILKTGTKNAKNQLVLPGGDIIVDTAYHFVLLLREDGKVEWGTISMYSTQMKKSRNWLTVMRNVLKRRKDGSTYVAPTYSQTYKITTLPESKDKYNWYGLKIEPVGELTDPGIYNMAREFSQAVVAGKVMVSLPSDEHPDAVPANDGGEGAGGDVPF